MTNQQLNDNIIYNIIMSKTFLIEYLHEQYLCIFSSDDLHFRTEVEEIIKEHDYLLLHIDKIKDYYEQISEKYHVILDTVYSNTQLKDAFIYFKIIGDIIYAKN